MSGIGRYPPQDKTTQLITYQERTVQSSQEKLSSRKAVNEELGSYNDRNDGFLRKYFSKSCVDRERINKKRKRQRVKPDWKR